MSDTLPALNIQRGGLKRRLTAVEAYFRYRKSAKESKTTLEAKLEEVELIYKEYQEVQSKIEQLMTEDNEASIQEKAEEFENKYQSIVNKIEEKFEKLNGTETATKVTEPGPSLSSNQFQPIQQDQSSQKFDSGESGDEGDTTHGHNEQFVNVSRGENIQNIFADSPPSTSMQSKLMPGTSNNYETTAQEIARLLTQALSNSSIKENSKRIKPKLPEFKLPQFSGNREDWIAFRDTFQSLIHNDKDIDNIDKFNYLLACLADPVKEEIAGFRLSSANYTIVWDALKSRYDDERMLMAVHLDKLFACKPAIMESAVELRRILNCFRVNMAQLLPICPDSKYWDGIVVYMIKQRVDSKTRKALELSTENPVGMTFDAMLKFLEKRSKYLEQIPSEASSAKSSQKASKETSKHNTKVALVTTSNNKVKCNVCQRDHLTFLCPELKNCNPSDCVQKLKNARLCFNCLQPNHSRQSCTNSKRCRVCQQKHHTILHSYYEAFNQPTKSTNPPPKVPEVTPKNHEVPPKSDEESKKSNQSENKQGFCAYNMEGIKHVFLSTAVVLVEDKRGMPQPCRVLLDNGAQSNFMTENFAQSLRLKRNSVSVTVTGLNQEPIAIKHAVSAKVLSRVKNYTETMECLVVPAIAGNVPNQKIPRPEMEVDEEKLADPYFNVPAKIDMLIGAEYFLELLQEGRSCIIENQLYLKNSVFGYIVTGKLEINHRETSLLTITCHMNVQEKNELTDLVEKFWKTESLPEGRACFTEEEKFCEENFKSTTKRAPDGRFIVTLPAKNFMSKLEDNRNKTVRRLYQIGHKLKKIPQLAEGYAKFMNEYETLGHMVEILETDSTGNQIHYLPHHPVIKDASTTTKIRIVFDASCKDTNGLSLNDCMCVGPVIQQSLFSMAIRFRVWQVILCADIKMMYRQILLDKSQQDLHRIIMKDSKEEKLKFLRLVTLTYGTASASFIAARCLMELVTLFAQTHPNASKAIEKDMFMDNLLTGADTISHAIELRDEINHIMSSCQFYLRKWMSNETEVLRGIKSEDIEDVNPESNAIITLGLKWNPRKDTLLIETKDLPSESRLTKRKFLSIVAGLFDPIGLISPIIVKLKIFIQFLWSLKIDWDTPLDNETQRKAEMLLNELKDTKQIQIDRCVTIPEAVEFQIHGFADASESAYGACVYLRSVNGNNEVRCRLLSSKSKVAPLQRVTLARLELSAAKLLSELYAEVRNSLAIEIERVVLWSDSSIALHWIKTPSYKLQTFVANRVSFIQTSTNDCEWRHVSSNLNPADIASRGASPKELMENIQWWNGPEFLSKTPENWPESILVIPSDTPEMKGICLVTQTEPEFFQNCETSEELIRIVAHMKRFFHNCRTRDESLQFTESLSTAELESAEFTIIRQIQRIHFPEEMKANGMIPNNSSIKSLDPFIDSNGILRVGGRIENSNFDYDKKHPIILPHKHQFVENLIRQIHRANLHSGQRAALSYLRQKYWPIKAKNTIRKIIHECIKCFRVNPKPVVQFMGNLPDYRVSSLFPFHHTGVDGCGPVYVKIGGARSTKLKKAYIMVFVCMATKIVHLELVGDMSGEAFLAAFDRFLSRRGLPTNMHSDNGTNFIAAARELRESQDIWYEGVKPQSICNHLAAKGIQWHFIPPRAPEFGGQWESTVKSVKYHLKRVVGLANLTFEEMTTVLCKIEAVLNSRPLFPESDDPKDCNVITPGHFAIGRPMNSRPEENLQEIPYNRLHRWQRIQKITQDFWRTWSIEYIHQLQQRQKRFKKKIEIKVGELVLLVDENQPPMRWLVGRITKIHPGKDNIVRVITAETPQGESKRPVSKVCLMPRED